MACDGCPPVASLLQRYDAAGGSISVCPICFDARKLDKTGLLPNAELGGTVPLWQWIGEEGRPRSATEGGRRDAGPSRLLVRVSGG